MKKRFLNRLSNPENSDLGLSVSVGSFQTQPLPLSSAPRRLEMELGDSSAPYPMWVARKERERRSAARRLPACIRRCCQVPARQNSRNLSSHLILSGRSVSLRHQVPLFPMMIRRSRYFPRFPTRDLSSEPINLFLDNERPLAANQ